LKGEITVRWRPREDNPKNCRTRTEVEILDYENPASALVRITHPNFRTVKIEIRPPP